MALAAEDRTAIAELLALHGHLFDEGELHRLDELFTADVVYDVSDFGQPPLKGVRAIREAAFALGEAIPVGHHVTNIVLTELPADGGVQARSKGIGVNADGTCGTVTYEDTVVRAADGWRISHRKVLARRAPLGGR
ncbi:nuclear transport factor 2 family protein [Streptomyces purpurogeneiscleroticus]|uniref:nuclear transport factor 2 family protein n=1 Tax=Streptomyces purpurogeneiscleroticus TaxID=68259 RepID=UPI001CC0D1EB|nr:nuclear transport factor 2 family protein [Streptomyces purpurogeneiscleroticus]MBZ4016603.1 polyketide cyclase [Streptomyces purpurogeneiscleroticus]